MSIRIGNGYDVHRFAADIVPEATLTIGGVRIPHERPLLAHSDGDVLVHALCDALLGALALGDIGKHFPDTDLKYRGINSLRLLQHVIQLVDEHRYRLGNVDLTLVAQVPKFAPHIADMRTALAEALQTDLDRVSVKATTTEGLGFAGRREGIACYAVVLLESK